MGPATSIATDLKEGIVDRFRSLPMARSAYILGHLLAEFAAATLGIAVLCLSGLIVGWRIHTDLPHALAGFALLLLFAFAMLVVGTLLGLLVRSPDAAQGFVFIVVFPMTFIAATFVPLGGLPPLLRTIAEYNPMSALAAACRTLFGNPVDVPADRRLAARAPGAERVPVVRRDPRGRDAADALALPRPHQGLAAQRRSRAPIRPRTRQRPRSRGGA